MAEAKLVLQSVGFPWHIVALEEVGRLSPLERLGVAAGCPRGAPACVPHVGWPGPHALPAPPPPKYTHKVFSLPPSVLRCSAREPVGTEGAYKAAVDSFLQQQHALGEGQQSLPCPPRPPIRAGPPTAGQTEALSTLFSSVETLTAKEELLQTLR